MVKSAKSFRKFRMSDFKVGQQVVVQLPVGRLVTAKIVSIVHISLGIQLLISFGDETAEIYPWQVLSWKESVSENAVEHRDVLLKRIDQRMDSKEKVKFAGLGGIVTLFFAWIAKHLGLKPYRRHDRSW